VRRGEPLGSDPGASRCPLPGCSVTANLGGVPKMLVHVDRERRVSQIIDFSRIGDAWLRDEIARRYFRLEPADGSDASVFQDLVNGH
jgi:hypothetical protein